MEIQLKEKVYVTIVYQDFIVTNKYEQYNLKGDEKFVGRTVRRVVYNNLAEFVACRTHPVDIFLEDKTAFAWAVFGSLEALEPIYCSKEFPIAWYASVEAKRLGRPEISPSRIGMKADNVKPEDLLGRRSGKSLFAAELYSWLYGKPEELIEQPEKVEMTWLNHDKRSHVWKLTGSVRDRETDADYRHITQFFTSLDDLHQYIDDNHVELYGIYEFRVDPITKNAIWNVFLAEHLRCVWCGSENIVINWKKEPTNHVTR